MLSRNRDDDDVDSKSTHDDDVITATTKLSNVASQILTNKFLDGTCVFVVAEYIKISLSVMMMYQYRHSFTSASWNNDE
jgi:hypothetical protein